MNVHIFYVSLLVIAAGFIGYLKLELDSNLEKFENGKQALSKNLAQLKETIKRTEGELNKCKKSLSSFEPLLKEVEEAKKKLSDVTQSSSTCTQAKENIEVEMQSLKNNLQKETSDKTGLAQKLASCEAQKNEATLKANQEVANSKACHDLKNQCQQEKATFEAEQIKWKKQVEDTTAAWQSEKNNLIKATGDLQACQQNAAALQNQRDQLAQTSNLCVGDKQKCEADKVACLQALEAERVVKQQLQQQLQQHQQRVQQQQQVPPQQQQVPPQQQQVPPQQQQVPPQQQQQVPPQQQQQVPPQQQQAPPQQAQP